MDHTNRIETEPLRLRLPSPAGASTRERVADPSSTAMPSPPVSTIPAAALEQQAATTQAATTPPKQEAAGGADGRTRSPRRSLAAELSGAKAGDQAGPPVGEGAPRQAKEQQHQQQQQEPAAAEEAAQAPAAATSCRRREEWFS